MCARRVSPPHTATHPIAMSLPTIPLETFCAWRATRARLDRWGDDVALVDVLRASGWLLAPGSSAPYLSLRGRSAAGTRAAVDQAVLKDRSIVRVTGVRGEAFYVPADEAVLAVAAKGRRIDARIRQINKVVPISRGEIETLGMAIAEFLDEGPATVKQLEEGLPGGMLRSFGTDGRRAGVSGVLPVAMDYMEEEGKALLLDEGDRIDADECRYYAAHRVVEGFADPLPDQLDVLPEALRVYLRSFGPARFEDFVWWAGTTLNRSKTAAKTLASDTGELVSFEVESLEGTFVALPDDFDALQAFERGEPVVALLPNRDAFYLGRKFLNREFIDVENHEQFLARFRGKAMAARVLPSVVVDGRLVGIWEWNPDDGAIRWTPIEGEGADPTAIPRDRVDAAVADLAAYMRDELGGTFVLDLRDHGQHWAYGIDEIRSFW